MELEEKNSLRFHSLRDDGYYYVFSVTIYFLVQGTFLVGQPPHQTTAKQMASGTVTQGNTSAGTSSSQGQQALKVITGHKTATLFTQVTVVLQFRCQLF